MREIPAREITETVARLCEEANFFLPQDVMQAFRKALEDEPSPVGQEVLRRLIDNAQLAAEERIPICQDCGLVVVFADIGQQVQITGAGLEEAVNEGVRIGYERAYLRKSTCHPFSRANLGDNTPAVIYTRVVAGDRLHLYVVPKGGGSENMSRVKLLTPAAGLEGVKQQVLEAVSYGAVNACPPITVSVAVGGTFDNAAVRAKRALIHPLDWANPDPQAAALEEELLGKINAMGIGPAGFGGRTTALRVFVDIAPCHIASLPVAINIQCHAARHKEAVL